jgi:hypothetical protein
VIISSPVDDDALEHGPDDTAGHVSIVEVDTRHARRVSVVMHVALEHYDVITARSNVIGPELF